MRPLIAANWKMHKTSHEAEEFVSQLNEYSFDAEVLLCVPFTDLEVVAENNRFLTGAEDVFWEEEGAYTGEVSADMLVDLGVDYVIVGHSERRTMFDETDDIVNKKVKAALIHDLHVVLCVGENEEERDAGEAQAKIKQQLNASLKDIEDLSHVVVAYEPLWAIGTGKTASASDIEEMHAFIRSVLAELDPDHEVRVLYGGSVKPDNASEILSLKDVNGVLVGGASLEVDSFVKIIESA